MARSTQAIPSLDAGAVTTAAGNASPIVLYGPDGRPVDLASARRVSFGPGAGVTPRVPQLDYPPREFQYPAGFNFSLTPRQEAGKALSFVQLRALAAACPDIVLAVELRTKQLRGLSRGIAVKGDRSPEAREANRVDIERVTAFWDRPNRLDNLDFSAWLGQVLHEVYLTDALTLYKAPNRAGELHSLVQIDGSTIKPLIDPWGHVVGYQQILYGYPATQYRGASELDTGSLIQRQYNPRVGSVYGTTPVDDLEAIVNLAIRRLSQHVTWYAEGNVPVGFLEAPPGWTAEQIGAFQTYLDDRFSGDTKQRARLRMLPPGANYQSSVPFAFSKDESEMISRVVLAYFGVPVSLLISQVNRATAEETGRRADDVGLEPMKVFLKALFDEITQTDLEAPQLEWVWTFDRDPQRQATTKEQVELVTAGIVTRNEARRDRGLDPLQDPLGDVLGMPTSAPSTAPGMGEPLVSEQEIAVAPAAVLNGAQITAATAIVQQVARGELPRDAGLGQIEVLFNLTPEQARQIMGSAGAGFSVQPSDVPEPEPLPAEEEVSEEETKAAKAELGQWRRFATKRLGKPGLDAFRPKVLPERLSGLVKAGLAMCSTELDVRKLFDGAEGELLVKAGKKRLTKARVARHEARVERAYQTYFAREFRRVAALGDRVLKGNVDAEGSGVQPEAEP